MYGRPGQFHNQRNPMHTGLTTVGQAGADVGIPEQAATLAIALKAQGYETSIQAGSLPSRWRRVQRLELRVVPVDQRTAREGRLQYFRGPLAIITTKYCSAFTHVDSYVRIACLKLSLLNDCLAAR